MAQSAPSIPPNRPTEIGIAGSTYVLLALLWLWPLPVVAADSLVYLDHESLLMHADVDLMLWVLSWGSHALATQPLDLFSANSFYPSPLSLAFSEHLLGQQPLFAPIYAWTGNAVLATNVLIVLHFALCGLGMYLLARRFVSPAPAFLAGALFTFHPWRWATLGHFYVLAYEYIPFAFLFTERLLESGRRREALGIWACLVLQLTSSFYLAYALLLAYGVYLPAALWRWRSRLDGRRVVALVVAGVGAGLPFVATSVPYLLVRDWGFVPSYEGRDDAVVLGLGPIFTAPHVFRYLTTTGMGVVAYGFALVGVSVGRSSPHGIRGTALALVFVGVLLAFGPTIALGDWRIDSPFRLLQAWLPGFDAVRVPLRLILIAQVGLALLVALGAERVVATRPALQHWGVTAGAILVAWTLFGGLGLPTYARPVGESIPGAYRWLAANGEGRPLLELPRGSADRQARRMYLSSAHWLPIVGGYTAYPSDFVKYVYFLARGLPSGSSLARLSDEIDVGWVLVHRDEMTGDASGWNETPPGLTRVAEFGSDLLLRVDRKPSSSVLRRLLDGERSQGGAWLAPLAECPGRLEIVELPPEPWTPGQQARFRLRIRNEGSRAWPGMAVRPRHLVGISACLTAHGQPLCESTRQPLWRDLGPGEHRTVWVRLKVPPLAGEARLDVQLHQVGDGPLSACGVEPLSRTVRIAPRGRVPVRSQPG